MTIKNNFAINVSSLRDIIYAQEFGGFELVAKRAPQDAKSRN